MVITIPWKVYFIAGVSFGTIGDRSIYERAIKLFSPGYKRGFNWRSPGTQAIGPKTKAQINKYTVPNGTYTVNQPRAEP